MKLSKDVIEGIVEEELAEMQVRKSIRNQIQEVESEYRLREEIGSVLRVLDYALEMIDGSVSPDNRYIMNIVRGHFDEIEDELTGSADVSFDE